MVEQEDPGSGLCVNDKLDWFNNTDRLLRKGQSRLFFLRMVCSFNVWTLTSPKTYSVVTCGSWEANPATD